MFSFIRRPKSQHNVIILHNIVHFIIILHIFVVIQSH